MRLLSLPEHDVDELSSGNVVSCCMNSGFPLRLNELFNKKKFCMYV